jgi:hypothetical protein
VTQNGHSIINVNQWHEELIGKETFTICHVEIETSKTANQQNTGKIVFACVVKSFWLRRIHVCQGFMPSSVSGQGY